MTLGAHCLNLNHVDLIRLELWANFLLKLGKVNLIIKYPERIRIIIKYPERKNIHQSEIKNVPGIEFWTNAMSDFIANIASSDDNRIY